MAAITFSPTPIKSGLGKGFWVDIRAKIDNATSSLTDTSNYTSANTVAELLTAIDTIITTL